MPSQGDSRGSRKTIDASARPFERPRVLEGGGFVEGLRNKRRRTR